MSETLDVILMAVSEGFGVSQDAIKSKSRLREFVEARFAFWWIASKHTIHTTHSLGAYTKRHHASIIHGRRKHEIYFRQDKEYANKFNKSYAIFLDAKHECDNESLKWIKNNLYHMNINDVHVVYLMCKEILYNNGIRLS